MLADLVCGGGGRVGGRCACACVYVCVCMGRGYM